MKKLLAIMVALAVFLSGCGGLPSGQNNSSQMSEMRGEDIPSVTGEIFAMDTYMTITCYGEECEEALEESLKEIERLENLLSVGVETSDIAILNRDGHARVSDEALTMVREAKNICENTHGAFDITVYPLMKEWGFTTGNFSVPEQTVLDELLNSVNCLSIDLNEEQNQVTLAQGQGVDLGGIAKGFASDRLMEIFREHDLAAGVVSLGGNVECYGTKIDGSLWKVGIKDPFYPDDESKLMGVLQVHDKAVITSGAYERFFMDEKTGLQYHHILDPSTGYPADNELASVTVVCSNGMRADCLSTACFVMGLDRAMNYWRNFGVAEGFELILMTKDEEIYITQGLEDYFTSEYDVEIVKNIL